MQGVGFRLEVREYGIGYKVKGEGVRMQGVSRCRVENLGSWVSGSGVRTLSFLGGI
jgi:hypothetical protein